VAAVLLILPLAVSLAMPTSAQEASNQEVTFTLDEVEDSGVSGIVRLSPNGDQTDVAIRLTGATGNHPNHIHENFCANVDPDPLLPLTHIDVGAADPDGFTNSTVDISLDELLGGEYSILVHLSDDQLGQYVACGNLGTPDAVAAAAAAQSPSTPAADSAAAGQVGGTDATVSEVATTGVGSGLQPDLQLVLVVVSLAVLSAAVAIGAARRIGLR
jgi:hypothetical protein